MSGMLRWRRLIAVAAGLLVLAAGTSHALAQLASHRALYVLSLKTSSRTSGVAQLDGRMAIEIADACDGWTIEQRVVLVITTFDGDEVTSYTSFTSWESDDGRQFRFEQQTRHGDTILDELSGGAELDGERGGKAVLTKPEALEVALPPGTVFPTMHMEMLIEKALAGETFFSRVVFDGTSIDNPNYVSAFIGAPTRGRRMPGDEQAPKVWPVRLAFFHVATQASEPDVEIGLLLEANGITREIELDYGNFVIDGRLDELEIIPPIEC